MKSASIYKSVSGVSMFVDISESSEYHHLHIVQQPNDVFICKLHTSHAGFSLLFIEVIREGCGGHFCLYVG